MDEKEDTLDWCKKMAEKNNDTFTELLETFDQIKLDNIHERRMACKPLYDYFQILLIEIGVNSCSMDPNSLRSYHLKTRWENIKNCLRLIEDPGIWDDLIDEVHGIRSKIEHNDFYDPTANRLTKIRKKAPEFKDWITRVAKAYRESSSKFTFNESFYRISNSYINEALRVIKEYGEELEEYEYYSLDELRESLPERQNIKNVEKFEDVKRSDLEYLIQTVAIISQIKGKKEILQHLVCPKCGGKIKGSRGYFGEKFEEGVPFPLPEGEFYRLGCEKCEYELYSYQVPL